MSLTRKAARQVEAKAKELAEKTGISFKEAEAQNVPRFRRDIASVSAIYTAFEPEACSASREWYAERNKSCYIAGPSLPDDLFDDSEGY
ncbi:hypothetical protein Clacol_007974 [Clathrus columnatus]|uniref:Uncharacterized protein n=1 Tax=Clathrus columnatus TaxID=1419009 RepID=A0AAV5AKV6_9AGAM|nr:hypothetical protein Clacol_007974 [Clathrus columnatus]